jgi:hypothetical protein
MEYVISFLSRCNLFYNFFLGTDNDHVFLTLKL